MTVGFSLPAISPASSPAFDPTARGSGSTASPHSASQQPSFVQDVSGTGKAEGPSAVPASQAVDQTASAFAENKVVEDRPSDQAAITAATMKAIIDRAHSERAAAFKDDVGFEPLETRAASVESKAPSFASGLEAIRTMADPTGAVGESRLV